MKRNLFLFPVLLISCLVAQGQAVYHRFLEDGKAWHYRCWPKPTMDDSFYDFTLFVSGDTIIGGQEYKRICQDKAENYQFALREEDRKVYMVFNRRNSPVLLYDFSLSEGDTISPTGTAEESYEVAGIDTIKIRDRLFRRFTFRNAQEWTCKWIEGVGSYEYMLRPFPEPGQGFSFLSCEVDGDTILTDRDFTALPVTVESDNYLPLVKEGCVWVYDQREVYGQASDLPTMKLWFDGDTVIAGERFKRQYIEMIFLYPEYRVVSRYNEAWLEQDRKVYVWDGYQERKVLYYDFNLKKGDDVPDIDGDPSDIDKKVTDEDTIEVNGVRRRRLEITYINEFSIPQKVWWVEGIGSSMALFNPGRYAGTGGFYYLEYFEDGSCLFTSKEFYLPWGGSGIATGVDSGSRRAATDGHVSSPHYFDLQGRRLLHRPSRGMYIQDGKKVVVK